MSTQKVLKIGKSYFVLFITINNTDADGRIILRWIFRKWEGVVRNGWSWLRVVSGGGHL
jgi:hypothetical protein